MDEDVLSCILDCEIPDRVRIVPAILGGYRRVKLPHETYPLLVFDASEDGVVEGVLIYGLNKEELNRIVFFEGEEYELAPCQTKSDQQVVDALFFDEGVMPIAESEEWSFEVWRQLHKQYLIRQSRAYMSYYGKLSAKEADIHWQNYTE